MVMVVEYGSGRSDTGRSGKRVGIVLDAAPAHVIVIVGLKRINIKLLDDTVSNRASLVFHREVSNTIIHKHGYWLP